jgi:hypothetical protein
MFRYVLPGLPDVYRNLGRKQNERVQHFFLIFCDRRQRKVKKRLAKTSTCQLYQGLNPGTRRLEPRFVTLHTFTKPTKCIKGQKKKSMTAAAAAASVHMSGNIAPRQRLKKLNRSMF